MPLQLELPHTQSPHSSRHCRAVAYCSTCRLGSGVPGQSSAVQAAMGQVLPAWVNLVTQVDQFQGLQRSWTMLRQCICTVRLGLVAGNTIQMAWVGTGTAGETHTLQVVQYRGRSQGMQQQQESVRRQLVGAHMWPGTCQKSHLLLKLCCQWYAVEVWLENKPFRCGKCMAHHSGRRLCCCEQQEVMQLHMFG